MKNVKIILSAVVFCFITLTTFSQASNERCFQLSFIAPLGTNGMQSHLTTNKISFNILGGHSYSNTAFEFGGLYNVNTHFTKGFQFAGIANYTDSTKNVVQFGGVVNSAKKGTAAFQFGGILNAAGGVKGVQFAGVVNGAKKVSGLQLSGIVNYSGEVKGVQIGGVVNIAKQLRGVQVGLINYAEESDGVSVGLINIVKNGGKREFEVAFSEALHTAVSFKLGTDRLYTIFSGGINYIDQPVEYAAGVGFGTHIHWKKDWGNQIELMGYALTENGSFKDMDLNMLTQLKFTVSKEITRYFKVFAGPVLNMTISKYVNPDTGVAGSSLSPWSMWKSNSGSTRLNSWIGFSAGVRF